MQDNRLKPKNISFSTMVFFITVLLYRVTTVAFNSYLSDSEIWAISSTKLFWELAPEGTGTLVKPLFHIILGAPLWLSESSTELFLNARMLSLLLTMSTVAFSAHVIFKIKKSYNLAILTTILICGCYHFILWFPTVRSDSFACLPLLIAAFLIFKSDTHRPWLYIIMLQLAAVTITPKAILVIGMQYLALNITKFLLPVGKEKEVHARRCTRWLTVCHNKKIFIFLLLALSGVILLKIIPIQKFILAYSQAANYFLNFFQTESMGPPYLSLKTFYFLFRFLLDDFIFCIGVILSLIYLLICLSKRKTKNSYVFFRFGIYSLLCCLILVFCPAPLPFFISSFVPIFSIFLVLTFSTARPLLRLKCGKNKTLWIVSCAFIFLISITFFNSNRADQTVAEKFNNHSQLDILNMLEKTIPMNLTIYDGIGLFPFKKTIWGFTGPNENRNNVSSIDNVKKKMPDIILLEGRTLVYAPEFVDWVYENYNPLSASVWVLKSLVGLTELEELKKSVSKLDEEIFVLFQFKSSY